MYLFMVAKKEKNKSWLIITGSLILLSGIGLIAYDFYTNKELDKLEDNALVEFYDTEVEDIEVIIEEPEEKEEVKDQTKIEYIAVLKIPKINLERGLVNPSSYLNNVNYNVQIINGSDMPDVNNGNLILAGHSGNARISYFRNLNKLDLNDTATIIYKNKTYNYKVVDKYEIEKTGEAEIIRDKNKNILTLITCKHNTNKQIVIICELI